MLKELLTNVTRCINEIDTEQLNKGMDIIRATKGKSLIIGNGGSNAISSHMAEDYSKNYKAMLGFSDAPFITCFANDFGWENVYVEWLKRFADQGRDSVILISSSGASKNVIKCAEWASEHNFPLITLSGFNPENPLRNFGDVKFYVNSKSYKDVEITHLTILHTMLDALAAEL